MITSLAFLSSIRPADRAARSRELNPRLPVRLCSVGIRTEDREGPALSRVEGPERGGNSYRLDDIISRYEGNVE